MTSILRIVTTLLQCSYELACNKQGRRQHLTHAAPTIMGLSLQWHLTLRLCESVGACAAGAA
jgi:hypothetical protein